MMTRNATIDCLRRARSARGIDAENSAVVSSVVMVRGRPPDVRGGPSILSSNLQDDEIQLRRSPRFVA